MTVAEKTSEKLTQLQAAIQDLEERTVRVIAHVEEVAERVDRRVARGTLQPVEEQTMRPARSRREAIPAPVAGLLPASEFYARVEALLRERPRTHRELAEAAGDSLPRTYAVIAKLRRRSSGLVRIGGRVGPRWFLVDEANPPTPR